jgi:hypothetical protein
VSGQRTIMRYYQGEAVCIKSRFYTASTHEQRFSCYAKANASSLAAIVNNADTVEQQRHAITPKHGKPSPCSARTGTFCPRACAACAVCLYQAASRSAAQNIALPAAGCSQTLGSISHASIGG